METIGFKRNISSTACVIGLALTTMSLSNTMLISGDYNNPYSNQSYYHCDKNSTNIYNNELRNMFVEQKSTNRLEEEATKLFGTMRDATVAERASVKKFLNEISTDVGVNFFDIC